MSSAAAANTKTFVALEARVPRVLVVDDNRNHAELVERALSDSRFEPKQARFEVAVATDAEAAGPYISDDSADVYIVDLGLEELDKGVEAGQKLISDIRDSSNAGIIAYSSQRADVETVPSILLGADDYVWKSWGPQILKIRVFALWRNIRARRHSVSEFSVHEGEGFLVGQWHFVAGNRVVEGQDGQTVKLSGLEYAILLHLLTVEDHEINREGFVANITGRDFDPDDRRLDSLIYRMKKKLGESLQIVSVRDAGYKLLNAKPSKGASTISRQSKIERLGT